MSGFWADGFWQTSFWAEGFWYSLAQKTMRFGKSAHVLTQRNTFYVED